MRKTLQLLAALLAVGTISASVLVTSALAGTTPTPANLTIPLNNNTAEPGEDCPATGTYWHFVISPNNGDSYFIEFHLNLGDDETYDTTIFVPNGEQLDNVFVAVPSGKTLTSLIKAGSTAEIHWNGETPTPAKFQLSHTCGGIPPAADPTVSKAVSGSYDETFVWTPDKKADTDTVYSAGGGESGEVNYTVSVSHDEGTVDNVKVSGTITVTNPNDGAIELDSVTDGLSDDTDCTVDVGDPADYTIPANGSKDYPYECELDGLPEGNLSNTATITWSDQTLSDDSELAGDSAFFTTDPISFTATEIDECVTVDDTNPDGPQDEEVCVGDLNPTEFEYSETFTDDEGTCTPHENTASIETNDKELTDEAKTTVKDCQGADLTVSKTATPSFTRAYDWNIAKDVDQDADGSTTFDYTVSVSHDVPGIDSEWKVVGTITITNPNDWQDITLTSLSDVIDNGGVCTLDEDGPYTVPASDSIEVDYTCTYLSAPDPAAFTNTATAGWDALAAHTPNGSASGVETGEFGNPTTEIDECIDVVDDNGTPANLLDDVELGQVCVGDANPTEFEYSKTLDVTDAKCVTYTNTASYSTTDDENDTNEVDSASQTVEYCRPATIGYWKNHMYQCAPRERTGTNGCSNNGPFTAAFLPQLLGNYSVNTTALALAVFNANNCSNAASSDNNASACLAAQLLGAKLNVANNGPSCIAATIAAADSFLINNVLKNNVAGYNGPTGGAYTLSTRAQAIAYKTTLDNYNKGLGCPV